jgi:hypothetical protein
LVFYFSTFCPTYAEICPTYVEICPTLRLFNLFGGQLPPLPPPGPYAYGCNKVEDRLNHKDYLKKWSSAMNDAYTFASEHATQNSSKGKRHYYKGARYSTLKPGDRVLVRNLIERRGPGKLRTHWEKDIHIVVNCMPDFPVYEVKPEAKDGRKRLLHRNLLLPCDFLPLTPVTQEKTSPKTYRSKEG